ncbi:MAG: hypothetical protein LPH21_08790, partial [Shewanella sp.]|nr:hypothetical protein [Shewanella sp.]
LLEDTLYYISAVVAPAYMADKHKQDIGLLSSGYIPLTNYRRSNNNYAHSFGYAVTRVGAGDIYFASKFDAGVTKRNPSYLGIQSLMLPLWRRSPIQEMDPATVTVTTSASADMVVYQPYKVFSGAPMSVSTTLSAADYVLWNAIRGDISSTVSTAAVMQVVNHIVGDVVVTTSSTPADMVVNAIPTDIYAKPLGGINTILTNIQKTAIQSYRIQGKGMLIADLDAVTGYSPSTLELTRTYAVGQIEIDFSRHYQLQVEDVVLLNRYYSVRPTEDIQVLEFDRSYELRVGQAAPNELRLERVYPVLNESFEDRLLQLINEERTRLGINQPVVKFAAYDTLPNISAIHSHNITHTQVMNHNSPAYPEGYKTVADRAALLDTEYTSWASENIAFRGTPYLEDLNSAVTADALYEGWRNSPGHYANMIREHPTASELEVIFGLQATTTDRIEDTYHGKTIETAVPYHLYFATHVFIVSRRDQAVPTTLYLSRPYALEGMQTVDLYRGYPLQAYTHIMASFEARYTGRVAASLESNYSAKVSRALVAPITWKVGSTFQAQHGVTTPVSANTEVQYDLKHGDPVASYFEANHGLKVGREFLSPYETTRPVHSSFTGYAESTAEVRRNLSVHYEELGKVKGELIALFGGRPIARKSVQAVYDEMLNVGRSISIGYGEQPRVAHSVQFSYGEYGRVGNTLEAAYGANSTVSAHVIGLYEATAPISKTFDADYNLLGNNRVTSTLDVRYHLVEPHVNVSTGSAKLIVDGRVYKADSIEISLDEESTYWKGTLTCKDASLFALLRKGKRFTLNFFGTEYLLVVDSRSTTRGGQVSVARSLDFSTIASLRGRGNAPTVTYMNTVPVLASDLAEQVLGAPIQWNMVDWAIPAFRYSVEALTPIEAAKVVVEVAGGILTSNESGEFIAQPKHKASYVDYHNEIDFTISDVYDNLNQSETPDYIDVRNRFRITEALTLFSDVIEYVADESVTGEELPYGD